MLSLPSGKVVQFWSLNEKDYNREDAAHNVTQRNFIILEASQTNKKIISHDFSGEIYSVGKMTQQLKHDIKMTHT